jgi:hypothetical protein
MIDFLIPVAVAIIGITLVLSLAYITGRGLEIIVGKFEPSSTKEKVSNVEAIGFGFGSLLIILIGFFYYI